MHMEAPTTIDEKLLEYKCCIFNYSIMLYLISQVISNDRVDFTIHTHFRP